MCFLENFAKQNKILLKIDTKSIFKSLKMDLVQWLSFNEYQCLTSKRFQIINYFLKPKRKEISIILRIKFRIKHWTLLSTIRILPKSL